MSSHLEAVRLYLRPFTPGDFEDFYRLCSDTDIMRYIGKPDSREQAKARLNRWLTYTIEDGLGAWAVIQKSTGDLIGYGFLRLLEQTPEVELGYGLFKAYWGKGLATEVAIALLRWGFEEKGCSRIVALGKPQNIASWRIMEKLGMEYVGLMHHYSLEMKYYSISSQIFQQYHSVLT